MAYLLDANVLISAKNDHYRFGTFPSFWAFLLSHGVAGTILSIDRIEAELVDAGDDLSQWVKACPTGIFLPRTAGVAPAAGRVSAWVNDRARPYSAAAKAQFFSVADYWLVAYALAHQHTVVTHEKPDPNSKRRVKIPDVCIAMGVPWIGPFEMLESLSASF